MYIERAEKTLLDDEGRSGLARPVGELRERARFIPGRQHIGLVRNIQMVRKDGPWFNFNENGQLAENGTYKDGKGEEGKEI